MIWALLAALARGADISVPADIDPLGWARAWSQIVDAQQDPSLDDTRITWTRDAGRWVLTLEHRRRRATVDGLEPAADDAGRVEQLYVALGLVGRTPASSAHASLQARLAPPPRPEPPPAPLETPIRPLLPREGAGPPPVPEVVALPPPPVDEVHISVVDVAPPDVGAPYLVLVSLDSQAAVALRVQGGGSRGRLGLAARAGLRLDPDVHPRDLTFAGRLWQWSVDLSGLVELQLARRGLWAGLSGGGDVREVRTDGAGLGRGIVPTVGAHIAYLADGPLRVRVELGLVHDLRAQGIVSGIHPPVFLPADRVLLTVGLGPGRRS